MEPEGAAQRSEGVGSRTRMQCLMKDDAIAGSSLSKTVGRWGVTEADEYSGELHIVYSFMPAWVKPRSTCSSRYVT